jgi:segregation and condensation protein B
MEREIIEAALFITDRPISLKTFEKRFKKSREEIEEMIGELSKKYSSGPIEISSPDGDRFVMRLKPEYLEYTKDFASKEFGNQILRTLSVIAYYQPITLAKLAKIRGNKCYSHVKKLEAERLVKTAPKGRTKLITTAESFSHYFGIESDDPEFIKEKMKELWKGDENDL